MFSYIASEFALFSLCQAYPWVHLLEISLVVRTETTVRSSHNRYDMAISIFQHYHYVIWQQNMCSIHTYRSHQPSIDSTIQTIKQIWSDIEFTPVHYNLGTDGASIS